MRSTDVESLCAPSDEGEILVPVESKQWRRATGLVLSIVLIAGCVGVVVLEGRFNGLAGSVRDSSLFAEVGCSAPNDNCIQSKCCIDGGEKGYQCYKKNEEWGECIELDGCEPGVHKGEKHGIWDAQGKFQLDKWSCDKAGEPSKPGCSSFSANSTCPADRCSWANGVCRPKCSTLPNADTCWNAGHCMWDGSCKTACWEVGQQVDCSTLPRCMWVRDSKGEKCSLACHIHAAEEECPHEEQCMWVDGKCTKDPCSAQWEDCRETKCCSGARGATGMTCTEKNKDYASCLEIFDPKYQKNWTGKKLGERTKFASGCSWAGQSCSETRTCCNEGYNCMKKDDTFAGCALSMKVSTWVKQSVPPPEGWSGEVIGGWRGEYEAQSAPEGTDMAGTSFYCFMAVLPDSPEMELLDVARKNNASIFGCDEHSVFHSWQTAGQGWDTGETTLVNTAVFLKVFHWARDEGKYLKHDWTIKVDADCVFVPQRLREHMWALRPPAGAALYMKNNNLEGLGNAGFLGAVEVFSKLAVKMYLDNDEDCGKYLGTDSGEDGFFKGCMDALGVGFVWDKNMFTPNYDPATCTKGMYAAFHPIKYPSHWQRCWDIATGKMCQGLTYDCGGALEPPVESLAQVK